jgi:hypothetical protein
LRAENRFPACGLLNPLQLLEAAAQQQRIPGQNLVLALGLKLGLD